MSLLQSFLVLTVLASLANAHHLTDDSIVTFCDENERPSVYTPSRERVFFVPRASTYSQAITACENLLGHLFYPKTTEDHKWLVQAIHHVNFRRVYPGPATFWVSLIAEQSIIEGQREPTWVTETGAFLAFINLPQQTIATGYEVVTNNQAFAVPTVDGDAVYQFVPNDYSAEYFVCVSPDYNKIKQNCDIFYRNVLNLMLRNMVFKQ